MSFYVLSKGQVKEVDRNTFWDWDKIHGVVKRKHSFFFLNSVRVTTTFMGIDFKSNSENSSPKVFETMIFGGPFDGLSVHSSTLSSALFAHKECEKKAKNVSNFWRWEITKFVKGLKCHTTIISEAQK